MGEYCSLTLTSVHVVCVRFTASASFNACTCIQNNGKHILWEHLSYLYEHTQTESGLYVGHRLTYEHVHLTSFSKMKVNLAAQVCFCGLLFCIKYVANIIAGAKQLCQLRI